jgi:hypothetical protein
MANADRSIEAHIMDSALKPDDKLATQPVSILPTTAYVAAGSVATTAAFIGVTRLASGLGNLWIDVAVGVLFWLLAFAALLMAMERYSSVGWEVPQGSENSDWALRKRVAVVLGVLVVAVAAGFASARIVDPLERALTSLIAVIMAVAGANDIRRFRLPLPLTLVGLGASVLLFIVGPFAMPILILALAWATLMIVIHIFVARSGMALGDMIALFWIALASPFNGLVAVFLSQITMDVLGRITTWKKDKKRIPIGGAWLVATAAAIALPHWPMVISAATANAPLGLASAPAEDDGARMRAAFEAGMYTEAGLGDLSLILRDAAYLTARISMLDTREQRIVASVDAAGKVAEMRTYALQTEVPKRLKLPVAEVLQDLSRALAAYDVDGVRAAASRLKTEREQVDGLRDAYVEWKKTVEVASSNGVGEARP